MLISQLGLSIFTTSSPDTLFVFSCLLFTFPSRKWARLGKPQQSLSMVSTRTSILARLSRKSLNCFWTAALTCHTAICMRKVIYTSTQKWSHAAMMGTWPIATQGSRTCTKRSPVCQRLWSRVAALKLACILSGSFHYSSYLRPPTILSCGLATSGLMTKEW